jgi:hypothetical protein
MTDISLAFGTNNVTIYTYEPFSYTISNPNSNLYTLSTTKTSGLPASYLINNANDSITFASTSNGMLVGTQQFTISADPSGGTSTTFVTIGPGRFVDGSGNSFVGSNYTFYAKEAITPIKLVAPFNITTPTSTPALPPGLRFSAVDGSSVSIVGTPSVTVPQSNYLIIGKNVGTSKIVSSTIPIIISNERIQTNLAGGSIISGMQIGVPITPRTLTATGNGTIRYTWTSFPDGIVVTDNSGNVQPVSSFGFTPSDPSYTFIITGTPTLAAANAFKNGGYSNGLTQSILVERVNPLPLISSVVGITFRFGETILFDTASNPQVYTAVPLDPSAISYRAATYFTSNVPISTIFSPDLRSDLSLAFNGTDRAYLTGTPESAGTGTFTIRAINANAFQQDTTTTISVVNDFITFASPPTPVVDVCYNFVVSRPSSLSLNGYYPSPIEYSATAASGRTIQWSAPALVGTGLSLSATSGNTTTIVGTPTNILPLQTLAVTASATGTPATATRIGKIEIVNDVFTFATAGSLSFIQNKPITPVQFTATTLSGRQVSSYFATGLPLGLSLSTTGRLSGTSLVGTNGSFTIGASTGFTNGNQVISYTITPDNILLIVTPQASYPLTLGGPIPAATINGLTYSGANVSNYVFSNLSPTYGLTINSTTGVFGGTFTTSLPPQDLLPSNVSFYVNATAGALTESLAVEIDTLPPPAFNWYALTGNNIAKTLTDFDNWSTLVTVVSGGFTDMSIRQVDLGTLVIVGVTGETTYVQSSNGSNFTTRQFPPIGGGGYESIFTGPNYLTFVSNTSTLYGVGTYNGIDGFGQPYRLATFFKSFDDGISWTGSYPILPAGIPSPSFQGSSLQTGYAIAHKNGVILLGGEKFFVGAPAPSIVYSTDQGNTWNEPLNAMEVVVTCFSTEESRWIAGGSDYYTTEWTGGTGVETRTLRYSDNQGVSWNLVSSGDFNFSADFVIRGNGIWIAAGKSSVDGGDTSAFFALRYSTDGDTWSAFTLPPGPGSPFSDGWTPAYSDPPGVEQDIITSVNYDGANYNIAVFRRSDMAVVTLVYQHAADGSSLDSDWEIVSTNWDTYADGVGIRRLQGRYYLSTPPITSTLNFPSQIGNGPTLTSPSNRSFLLYQYVPITPIQLTATGTGAVYFFLLSEQLPSGLSFDPVTNQITGTPGERGQSSVTIYAKDINGVTAVTLGFTTILPTIQKQQSGAGAWTYLLRQYTEVNAAVTSRDTKVTPSNEYMLGEFTRPVPPNVTTDSNCPC